MILKIYYLIDERIYSFWSIRAAHVLSDKLVQLAECIHEKDLMFFWGRIRNKRFFLGCVMPSIGISYSSFLSTTEKKQ